MKNRTHLMPRLLEKASPRCAAALASALFALSLPVAAHAQKFPPARGAQAARGQVKRPAREEHVPAETLLRIVRAEDERRWEATDLGALLTDRSAAVRRRAALAAGRIGDEDAIGALASMLRADRDEGVRAASAFALGETESAAGAGVLLDALHLSKAGEVRMRIVEALGKVAGALPVAAEVRRNEIGGAIISALEAERQKKQQARDFVLAGLTAAMRSRHPGAARAAASFLSSPDARVRADALNVLARLRAKESLEQVRRLLTSDVDPVVRANAARVLGGAEDAPSLEQLTARATGDTDSRVRVSALRSVALLKDARAGTSLLRRGEELLASYLSAKSGGKAVPSEQNELLEVVSAIGRVLANTSNERGVELLRRARRGGLAAPEVEIALARIAPAQYQRDRELVGLLEGASGAGAAPPSWQLVSAVGQGLGELANVTSAMGGNSSVGMQADAQIMLRSLVENRVTPPLAVPDLLRALVAYKPADLAALMRSQLKAEDVIVRATAADVLGELPPDPETARALAEALPRALAEKMNDAALSILGALAKQKTPQAAEAIRTAFGVPDYVVRRRAVSALQEATGAAPAAGQVETVATHLRPPDYQRALARVGKEVRAVVETDKGSFTMRLLPNDAPLTVDNFVQLARAGFFRDVPFHRVVPNFVIQGGDPRGDGNGGPGYQIRCEINTVPYDRGAVGMALSGKDTGGSQWFVTHSPQPHLDGGYTVFGRVVEGMEVVDAIARGDRIRGISITEGAARRP